MNPDRWRRIEEIYNAALELEPGRRDAYLAEVCAGDESLREEVEGLLREGSDSKEIMRTPAFEFAARALAEDRAARTSADLIGRSVSHYRIVEKIGQGGMGEVYMARDTQLDRNVALKVLPVELMGNPERMKRFVQEAKAASRLNHPNIVTIHEIDRADGIDFLVMEYVAGKSLDELIPSKGMALEKALPISIQIAEALAAAHAAGIVHRDLKPGNVMVTENGQVKVLDFGLAKIVERSKFSELEPTKTIDVPSRSLTEEGMILGTVAYMSPEQAEGKKLDARSDIFSFGSLLYEMITGRRAFQGQSNMATLSAILREEPKPVSQIVEGLPSEVERIINRCLRKDWERRWQSIADVKVALQDLKEESGWKLLWRGARKKRVAIPAFLLLLVLGLALGWIFNRQAKMRWARGELLPKINQLIEAGWENYVKAYEIAVEAERFLPNDPTLTGFFSKIATHLDLESEPPGARVYMKEYVAPGSEWKYLGTTPVKKVRLPLGCFRWKMEKEGYQTVLASAPTFLIGWKLAPYNVERVLDKNGSIPPGMVRVKGSKDIVDFFIDQYEVTNRQFKLFVTNSGYQKKEYWKQRFIKGGKELTWEEALKNFVDHTGQRGPANWEAGDYPEGQADYPVSGISWYEAAAYAEFVGKTLPTADHWGLARGEGTPFVENPFYSFMAPLSNFKAKGPAPVGSFPGMTSYGAYDMAGNVREWCWNEAPSGRIIRGGAWNDADYMFQFLSQAPPFDRSDRNGFRCALYIDANKIPNATFQPVNLPESTDPYKYKPVSDSVFQVYKDQFSYDKMDLNERTEWRSESSDDFVQEKITFDAAYDNDRVIAYLFLPRKNPPPYQTLIYFPGNPALNQRSSRDLARDFYFDYHLSFIIKTGRAVLFPLYKGTFERGDDALSRRMDESPRQYAEVLIKDIKDLKRSIDYLESRPDIDIKKLAYSGFSWGAMNGPIILAVEDRLKASVLYVGGADPHDRPEVNQLNYLSRVRTPTLMLNGRYDMIVPYEASAKPMYDLLGIPKGQKEQKLYDSDHYIPRNELIRETLNWLDRYLGPVR
jgi:formylglycine-generating enzyme required for sulfatase activity/predicted esterase/predicted Ser/Thr protein kinase